MTNRFLARGVRSVRRLVVGLLGATVVLVGIAMIVLPGPAFIVVPIGIGILALEFGWARSWVAGARDFFGSQAALGNTESSAGDVESKEAEPECACLKPRDTPQ